MHFISIYYPHVVIFLIHQNTKISTCVSPWCKILPSGRIGGIHPAHEGKVAHRANMCVYICACVRAYVMSVYVGEWKKRVTHDAYARQCMLALLPFLAPPPHLSHPRATRLSVYVCIMEAWHASWRRVIYPLLFAFAGRQRTEKKSTILLHGLARGTRRYFQFTTAIAIACVALHLRTIASLLFAFQMYIAVQAKMSAILIPTNSTINWK